LSIRLGWIVTDIELAFDRSNIKLAGVLSVTLFSQEKLTIDDSLDLGFKLCKIWPFELRIITFSEDSVTR